MLPLLMQVVQRTLDCDWDIPARPRVSAQCRDLLLKIIVKVGLSRTQLCQDAEAGLGIMQIH